MKLHASGEDYLETILVLQKKLGMVRSVDVARHMEVSKPRDVYKRQTLRPAIPTLPIARPGTPRNFLQKIGRAHV